MIPKILSGIDQNTGLSGQGPAIEQEVEYYQRTLVEPKQQIICEALEEIFRSIDIEVNISIDPLDPFTMFGSDELRMNTQTRNEIRAGEGMGPMMVKDLDNNDTDVYDERGFEVPLKRQENADKRDADSIDD